MRVDLITLSVVGISGGFLVTDIYWVSDYKLPTKLLLHLCHKLHDMGHDDSAKDRLKIPSILNSHCQWG